MLLIIVPVMALTIFFAWRYRANNKEATYKPDWDHSTQLELVIWSAPLLIIICLGAVIRGETTHDQHINRAVSLELARLSVKRRLPVAFGRLHVAPALPAFLASEDGKILAGPAGANLQNRALRTAAN